MNVRIFRVRRLQTWLASGGLLAFGGCGLSDQQLTLILESAFNTGLSTLFSSLANALVSGLTGGAAA